jgi:hypothetical protein
MQISLNTVNINLRRLKLYTEINPRHGGLFEFSTVDATEKLARLQFHRDI